MPDQDDKTKGRTSLPGQYERDEAGDVTGKHGGPKSFKSANDRRADSSQGDDDGPNDAGNVPADHG